MKSNGLWKIQLHELIVYIYVYVYIGLYKHPQFSEGHHDDWFDGI